MSDQTPTPGEVRPMGTIVYLRVSSGQPAVEQP
ncbi:MAG: hypothetical protein GX493_08040 [Firmicutes bacterium]|nr:hypothetical protein [Bacillota bacterium]